MSIEPTLDEASSFSAVRDVANWASVGRIVATDGDTTSAEQDPVRISLLALFGLQEDDHIRVLAGIPEPDFLGALREWVIPNEGASRAPTYAERSQAGNMGRAARIAAGTQRRLSEIRENADLQLRIQTTQNTSTSPHVQSGTQRVKLSHVVDQTSDLEVEALSAKAIADAYQRYDERLGGEPSTDTEPSVDQLTGVHNLVFVQDLPPFVDFAIFGPHHTRIARKLRFTGLVMNAAGELSRVELAGPTSFGQWDSCLSVFRTTCVMLNISSPAALDSYRDHVRRYSSEVLRGLLGLNISGRRKSS